MQDGLGLVGGIAGTVVCAIGFSYLIGLGVDARYVVHAGGRVVMAVLASLASLGAISLGADQAIGYLRNLNQASGSSA